MKTWNFRIWSSSSNGFVVITNDHILGMKTMPNISSSDRCGLGCSNCGLRWRSRPKNGKYTWASSTCSPAGRRELQGGVHKHQSTDNKRTADNPQSEPKRSLAGQPQHQQSTSQRELVTPVPITKLPVADAFLTPSFLVQAVGLRLSQIQQTCVLFDFTSPLNTFGKYTISPFVR